MNLRFAIAASRRRAIGSSSSSSSSPALPTTKIVFSFGSPVVSIDNSSTPTIKDIGFSLGSPTVTLDVN